MNLIEGSDTWKDLNIKASAYWDDHHVFGKPSTKRTKQLGDMALQSIIINSVVPFAVFLAKERNEQNLENNWIELLKRIKMEKNSVVGKFIQAGYTPNSAFESQALLQLHNNYCRARNCVNCAIGSAILKRD